ncbi:MAG: hypothetical protein JNK05_07780 [Myxococcales bacterium]|nr:hypothetical protein [Myxococcales bacterium]
MSDRSRASLEGAAASKVSASVSSVGRAAARSASLHAATLAEHTAKYL